LVNKERLKIIRFKDWGKLNKKLFLSANAKSKLRNREGTEEDGHTPSGKNYGAAAESEEHKKLKEWVAKNPQSLGIRKSFGLGVHESYLLSGDTVDVLFSDGFDFVTVEVKSCRSNDEDFRRGLYQCVKYKKVKEAEHLPNKVNVKTMLVTERKLNPDLEARARILKVQLKCVKVNQK
jgi:hypothetical protein